MVMTWFIGMYGVTAGFDTAAYLRAGTMPETVAITGAPDDAREFIRVEHQRAVAEARARTMPLAVAQALLALVLVGASVMAIAGRRTAASWITQALVANAVFSVVEYVLTRSVRAQYIDAVARAGPLLFAHRQEPLGALTPVLWWSERLKLVVFDLGSLGLALAAVRAKRARAYFEASRRVEEQTVEPDDEDP